MRAVREAIDKVLMCSSCFLGKAKGLYNKDQKAFFLIALVFIVGVALRLSFINATDISGDEVFFTTYAFKIAYLLWQNPLIAVGIAAGLCIFVYLVAVKRKLWAALLFSALLLAAKYAFGMPDLIPRVEPVYVLATAGTIFLTGLTPNIAGELVSTIALSGLALVGLGIGSKFGKWTGILAFSLLMLSPYEIFMSTTSFVSPLGFFFMFSGLAMFFKGLKKTRMLPGAGILASLAYATRLPTIISFPVFLALVFLKRKELLKKENRKNLAIFLAITFATLLFMAPVYLNQMHAVEAWPLENPRWDLVEAHLSSFVAQAASAEVPPSQDHFFMVNAMSLFYSPLFILLLLVAVPYSAWKALREKNLLLAALLFIGIGVFLAFFISLSPYQRINRGLGYDFPFIMLIAFMLCSGGNRKAKAQDASSEETRAGPGISGLAVKAGPGQAGKPGITEFVEKARAIAAIALVLVFIYSSLAVISVNNFRGLSEFTHSIPEDSLAFCDDTCYQLSYYRGIYRYDLSIRKPFFDKIFKPNPQVEALFQEKTKSLTSSVEDIPKADFALVRPGKLEAQSPYLEGFKRCRTIKNGGLDMVIVFARETCP